MVRVNFIFAGINVHDKNLAFMTSLNLRAYLLLIKRFAAPDNFFRAVMGMGHVLFLRRVLYTSSRVEMEPVGGL